MKTNEIKAAALEIVKGCFTCKEVKAVYPEIVEKYGRDDAKEICNKAKEMLKNNAIVVKANSTKVIDALKSGERVLKNVWKDILSDKAINQFALLVYNACNRDLLEVINKYASFKDAAGNCAIKHYSKALDMVYFTAFDLENSNVQQALKVAKDAIRNAKTAAIKGKYTCKVVDIAKDSE